MRKIRLKILNKIVQYFLSKDMRGNARFFTVQLTEPQKLFEPLSNFIEVKYRPNYDSKNLIIVFSHTSNISLDSIKYKDNVLFIIDKRQNYYVTHAPQIRNAIIEVAKDVPGEILLMGTSKGGFGALLIGGLCARKAKDRHWRILAFTPIVDISETGSQMPSAIRVRTRAEKFASVKRRFVTYNKVAPFVKNATNLTATVVYPLKSKVDAAAAENLAAPNVRLFPLYISMHTTLYVFMNKDRTIPENRIRLSRIFRNVDLDVRATAVKELDEIVSDIHGMTWLPSLDEMISDSFARGKTQKGASMRAADAAAEKEMARCVSPNTAAP